MIAQLPALAAESIDPISVFVDSQGGHVESGETVHDVVRFIRPRVRTVGTGRVASAAAHIHLAAPLEDRLCLPNTRFLLHQPAGGMGGSAADIEIEARELLKVRERLNRVIADRTGQPLERIEQDTRRNFWLDADAARTYGIVGRIVGHADEVVIDLANPLDFSKGMPPTLTVCNTDSLGEQIQRMVPETRVVKVLNTVNCQVMVQPSPVPGEHDLFLCGNDAGARAQVQQWLAAWFGWPVTSIIDLGDITAARGMEMMLPLWIRLFSTMGTPHLNLRVVVAAPAAARARSG